jgi:hypothetical protein
VGSRVHIVGTRGTSGALKGAQASVTVTKLEMTAPGGCLTAAGHFAPPTYDPMTAGNGAPGSTASSAKKPMSAQTKAIIAGVAIGGAAGGIAAAVCCKSN